MMIYVTGDLHGNGLRFQPQYFPEQDRYTLLPEPFSY